MSLQNWVLGIAGVVVVAGLWYGATHPRATIVDSSKVDVQAIAQAVYNKVSSDVKDLGSSTGPDSFFPCENHNGVTTCFSQKPLTLATSTPCSLRSPAATSTLLSTSLQITTGTSTATSWFLSTSTSAFATTTNFIPIQVVASGAQASLATTATTTPVGAFSNANVMAPNSFVVWTVAGTAITLGDTTHLIGRCQARFEQL